jgi:EmrB/QacA subfamily drug resistance transporter
MDDDGATALPSAAPAGRSLFLTVFPPIMLPVFLAVIDQTIVATALPAMAASLGDVDRISWVVVAYLVATTVAAPVYGRLADALGRRRLMLFALALFMAASVLCAISTTLGLLVASRVLQGLGGGGLMTLSQALIGEAVPARERGNFQGYLATVIATSSAFGPVAGGALTQWFGWPSVFLINLPLGALAVVLVLRLPRNAAPSGRTRFDGLGLVLLTGFAAPLLLALEQVPHLNLSRLPAILALAAVAAISLRLLLWQEKRARSPLISLPLLREPSMWRVCVMSACAGGALTAVVTFLPIYLLVVGGASVGAIGLMMLPLTGGVGIGSALTGRLISRTGRTAIFPSVGLLINLAVLLTLTVVERRLDPSWLPWVIATGAFFQGSAMPVAQVTAQSVAGARQLGAAAGLVQLTRSLGSMFGVAITGAALFALLAADPQTASLFTTLIERGPAVLDTLDPARRALAQSEIRDAFRAMYLTSAAFAALNAVMAWTLPMRRH